MITNSTGSHGSTMLPAISSATVSTPSSISSVTNWANDHREARGARAGTATFLISPAPPCTLPIDTPTRDREEVEREQAAQEVEREALEPARVADRWLLAEDVQEDDAEDHHLRQRVEQAPRPAEERLLVAGPQLLQGQQVQQVAMRRRSPDAHVIRECTAGRKSDVGQLTEVPAVGGLDDLGQAVPWRPAEHLARTRRIGERRRSDRRRAERRRRTAPPDRRRARSRRALPSPTCRRRCRR